MKWMSAAVYACWVVTGVSVDRAGVEEAVVACDDVCCARLALAHAATAKRTNNSVGIVLNELLITEKNNAGYRAPTSDRTRPARS
jgi:hypothetical protein